MSKQPQVPISKRDKSYRGVTESIHDAFIAYCNHNDLNTGDTLSQAEAEFMKNHPGKTIKK